MIRNKYIDVHAHLNFEDYDNDRKEVYERMGSEGVSVINIGTNNETSEKAIELFSVYGSKAIIGIHPIDVTAESDISVIKELIKGKGDKAVVGIGECGLDYFRTDERFWKKQKVIFREQIELAKSEAKPLMLHIRNGNGRDAYREAIDLLKEIEYKGGGDAHFYAGTLDEAKEFLEMGFYISFTGVITFTHDYDELVKFVPMDRILSETDSPYVAPVPHRGQRNEPTHVIRVINRMAEIKGVSLEIMAQNILNNAKKLFKLE